MMVRFTGPPLQMKEMLALSMYMHVASDLTLLVADGLALQSSTIAEGSLLSSSDSKALRRPIFAGPLWLTIYTGSRR